MLGMAAGLVCLRYERTDVPCLARYGVEEEDAELGRATMSIGDVLKGSQNRCGENRGEGGVSSDKRYFQCWHINPGRLEGGHLGSEVELACWDSEAIGPSIFLCRGKSNRELRRTIETSSSSRKPSSSPAVRSSQRDRSCPVRACSS